MQEDDDVAASGGDATSNTQKSSSPKKKKSDLDAKEVTAGNEDSAGAAADTSEDKDESNEGSDEKAEETEVSILIVATCVYFFINVFRFRNLQRKLVLANDVYVRIALKKVIISNISKYESVRRQCCAYARSDHLIFQKWTIFSSSLCLERSNNCSCISYNKSLSYF